MDLYFCIDQGKAARDQKFGKIKILVRFANTKERQFPKNCQPKRKRTSKKILKDPIQRAQAKEFNSVQGQKPPNTIGDFNHCFVWYNYLRLWMIKFPLMATVVLDYAKDKENLLKSF